MYYCSRKHHLRFLQVLPAVISSVEDHGYTLDFAISNVSGFLPFQNVEGESQEVPQDMKLGAWLATTVLKMEENGRVCTVGIGSKVPKSEVSLTSLTISIP